VLLVLTVLALVFPSAALVGYVPRYRYPVDPLLAVLVGAGLQAAVRLPLWLAGRVSAGQAPQRGSKRDRLSVAGPSALPQKGA
jgi:hypothetical protein